MDTVTYIREPGDVKDPKVVPERRHDGRERGKTVGVGASEISVYSTGACTPVLQRKPFPVWIAAAITRGPALCVTGQGA